MMKRLLIVALCLLPGVSARAYEAGHTHAGLTEQAAFSAKANRTFVRVWGLRRGLFEPVALQPGQVKSRAAWSFLSRFFMADPGCGCVPTRNYVNRALGWLVLGSVLEQLPPDRIRNHFLDPKTKRGLAQRKGHRGLARRVRWEDFTAGGGSLAGFVTGSNFDLTGHSPLVWARSKRNEFGLPALWKHFEASITAVDPAVRRHQVAMTLLAMGALMHLVEDMAVPSHVHNDFVVSHLLRGDARGGSGYETWVADRFGRFGLSQFHVSPVQRHRFADFFLFQGKGLAEWTARHFLSIGMFPSGLRPKAFKAWLARHDTELPPHGPFDLAAAARAPQYLWSADGSYRLVAYDIGPKGKVRFWMDRRVHAAYARRLLPAAIAQAAGLLRYFFRGRLSLSGRRSGQLTITNQGVGLAKGRLLVLLEARDGTRKILSDRTIARPTPHGAPLAQVTVPRQGRALAVFVGADRYGETIVAPSVQ